VKRAIESYLLRQMADPLPARLLDLPRTALVLRRIEHEGKVYLGTEDWVEVQHAGKSGKMTRAMLSKPAEEVVAPGSQIKIWRQKRLVQLLHDQSYESGPYDVYALPDGARGYKWWDKPDDSLQYTIEPENEFSDLWTPIREGQKPIYFLPWRMVTGWPLKGESGASVRCIDLGPALQSQHQRMVAAAY
jgi:hypothetical protein